jgi:cytochrome c553
MKRWARSLAVLLALLAIGGFCVAAAGLVPLAASSGHFAMTEWFLQFTKQRSVATHSLWVEPPEQGGPAQVLLGAAHFETGCRPCHGAPDLPRQPRVAQLMLPPPPNLSLRAPEYDRAELFYIVKHGIKLTGMPAWPAPHRDDEIAAVVSFLQALPGIGADEYRRLVRGDANSQAWGNAPTPPLEDMPAPSGPPRAVLASCGRCHGADGNGRSSAAFPKLAGQNHEYLVNALEAYATAARQSGVMQPHAAPLAADEVRELAAYYSRLPLRPRVAADAGANADPAAIDRGREIASRGVPDRRVPSCQDCHGPGPGRRTGAAPVLAGQYLDYLDLQLGLFAQRTRGGSAYAHLMDEVAPRLTRDQRRDVAAYYASLPDADVKR